MRTIGIDVSKDYVDLALLGGAGERPEHARRPNAPDDVAAALAWVAARAPGLVVLEATGPYHAPLLAALAVAGLPAALVNPARVAAYRRERGGRHKTDAADAALLARFGAERATELRRYVAPPAAQARLRAVVTYRDGLLARRTAAGNRRAAARWQAEDPAVLAWLDADLAELAERLAAVERELAAALAALPEAPVLLAMPGVGLHIAAAVLAFVPADAWGDAKAAAACAGVHPRQEVSGRRARSWLSKQGNARLRKCLYMGALVAVRRDPSLAAKYAALCARLPKQAALCAVMHALLRRMMGRLKRFYAGLEPFQA